MKTLITNKQMREYGVSRDLAAALARQLPHVKLGGKGKGLQVAVDKVAFERLLEKALAESTDLWELTREHSPQSLQAWLNTERAN